MNIRELEQLTSLAELSPEERNRLGVQRETGGFSSLTIQEENKTLRVDFFPNGRRRRTTYMVDGLRSGITREYYLEGGLKMEANYTEGLPDGERKEFRPDGTLSKKHTFELGVLNGVQREYTAGGIVKRESFAEGGVEVRLVREYHPNGVVKKEVLLDEQGKKVVKARHYDEFGVYIKSPTRHALGSVLKNAGRMLVNIAKETIKKLQEVVKTYLSNESVKGYVLSDQTIKSLKEDKAKEQEQTTYSTLGATTTLAQMNKKEFSIVAEASEKLGSDWRQHKPHLKEQQREKSRGVRL